MKSAKERMVPNMFKKSESFPALNEMHASPHSTGSYGTPKKATPFTGKSAKIKLTGGLGGLDGKGQRESMVGRRPSLERRRSMDGRHSSFRLGFHTPTSVPNSPMMGRAFEDAPVDMPSALEASESALPKFMRSNSLSCVRYLHRLDSGFLEKPAQIIGGNSPLVTEVSETVGRKLARILPWHPESRIQMVLAIRRREKFPRSIETDRIDVRPSVTHITPLATVILYVCAGDACDRSR